MSEAVDGGLAYSGNGVGRINKVTQRRIRFG